MSQQPLNDEPLVGEVRFRVPLPIVIPATALLVIAFFTIFLSKVLLSVPHEAATIIAIAVAANILAGCAFVALRPQASAATLIELVAVVIYPLIIGVAVAALNIGEEPAAAASSAETQTTETSAAANTIVAANVAFESDSLELKGPTASFTFDNQDTLEHNFAIYKNEDDGQSLSSPLYTSEKVAGGASTTFDIDLPKPGKYYFQCDIHPSMNGDLTVK
jgi:plastocyanin